MCQDCPTPRSRARGVLRELLADLSIPFVLYGVIGGLVALVYYGPF